MIEISAADGVAGGGAGVIAAGEAPLLFGGVA
jgi:hypothetical protein